MWAAEGLQTLQIAEDDNYWETNPVLGEHPTKDEIYIYFTGAILAGWVITYMLPANVRKYFQGFYIGTSASSVWHNHRIGLRVSF